MPEMKRSIKDSVFTLMFREPKYALQLYQALHPEDRDVTEEDCKIVTLENILTVGQYNDLGLLVRGRLLLLVEAQSIFTLNVVLRILLYLAETYKRYVDGQSLDLYGTRPVKIPRPELYVVYTGPRRDVPDTLHLSDLYFEGEGSAGLELEVKVCRASGTEDILGQYIRFCKIADENRKKYGPTERAVEETLRQCREEGILVLFLASREKEVRDIMGLLFSEERIREIHEYNVAKDAEEKGVEKGMEKGMEKGIRAMVLTLKKIAMAPAEIAQTLVEQFGLSQDTAEKKVQQYWS